VSKEASLRGVVLEAIDTSSYVADDAVELLYLIFVKN
jgi:hypothetical protein